MKKIIKKLYRKLTNSSHAKEIIRSDYDITYEQTSFKKQSNKNKYENRDSILKRWK